MNDNPVQRHLVIILSNTFNVLITGNHVLQEEKRLAKEEERLAKLLAKEEKKKGKREAKELLLTDGRKK